MVRAGLAAAVVAGVLAPAAASELIYRPLNPSFGGNPNLSAHLIGLAQIQNKHAQSNGGGGGAGIPQITFPPIMIDLGGTLPVEEDSAPAPAGSMAVMN
jgi:hypothetical protein